MTLGMPTDLTESPEIGLPLLFEDTNVLMISTLSYESENQSNEI